VNRTEELQGSFADSMIGYWHHLYVVNFTSMEYMSTATSNFMQTNVKLCQYVAKSM